METYQSRVEGIVDRHRMRMTSVPGDGLALALFRIVCGGPLLVWCRLIYVPILRRLERPATALARQMTVVPTISEIYGVAIDLYKALMTALMMAAYYAVWIVADQEWAPVVAIGIGFFAFGRLIEFIGTVGLLFFSRPSKESRVSFRPVVNGFWSYGEVALTFGVLYLVVTAFDNNAVASSGPGPRENLTHSLLASLYFSFITIATIGYGDLAPQTGGTRVLTILESFIGLFLTVAIIQKAMSRTPERPLPSATEPGGGEAPKPVSGP